MEYITKPVEDVDPEDKKNFSTFESVSDYMVKRNVSHIIISIEEGENAPCMTILEPINIKKIDQLVNSLFLAIRKLDDKHKQLTGVRLIKSLEE